MRVRFFNQPEITLNLFRITLMRVRFFNPPEITLNLFRIISTKDRYPGRGISGHARMSNSCRFRYGKIGYFVGVGVIYIVPVLYSAGERVFPSIDERIHEIFRFRRIYRTTWAERRRMRSLREKFCCAEAAFVSLAIAEGEIPIMTIGETPFASSAQ